MPTVARVVLVLLLAASIQAGCGGDDDGGDGDAPALEGTEWTLVDGVDAPGDSVPTLTLEEGIASGFGGCNSFTGGYELDDDSITIGPLAATLMACEDDKSAAEAAYVPALEAADSWRSRTASSSSQRTVKDPRFEAADAEDSSAAQVQQLEEEIDALREENAALEEQSAGFEQQAADLRQSLDDLQSEAEGGAAGAQEALDAARAQYEALADELGAKGQSLAQSRAELRRLRAESEAALAAAQDAASTAAERAEAQQARAELAEACLAGVADVLRRFYASDDLADAIERTTEELEQVAADCEQPD